MYLDYLSMGYMDLGCIGFEVYIGLVVVFFLVPPPKIRKAPLPIIW